MNSLHLVQDPPKFGPPHRDLYLAGATHNPIVVIIEGKLQCQGLIRIIIIIASIGYPCPGHKFLHLQMKLWWAPHILGPSAQDSSQESLASRLCLSPEVDWRNCFTSVSLPGLDSLKVTCLFGQVGLGDNAHLSESPPCRLLLRGPVVDGQLAKACHDSSNACNYVSIGDCMTVCNCGIICDCGIVCRRPVDPTTQCDPPGGAL